jgi:hypothetical protein
VAANPGKRHTVYLQMCPAGVQRKQVQAALFQLLKEGRLEKTAPTSGKNMFPFWHPPGYDGPLGGNFDESQLGPGREMKVSPAEVTKMIIFDILAEEPGLTAVEAMQRCAARGEKQPLKVINAALYSMKKDGHAQLTLSETEGGKVVRWQLAAATPGNGPDVCRGSESDGGANSAGEDGRSE